MDDKELSAVVWTGGFLLSIIGSLIVLSGSLFNYMFKQHRQHNYSEHEEIKGLLKKVDRDLTVLKTQHDEKHCERTADDASGVYRYSAATTLYGKICISETWKDVSGVWELISGEWKQVSSVQVCKTEAWKNLV